MKQKIILGMLSSDSYNDKDKFLSILIENGFNACSISDKIKEMSKYLLKTNDLDKITEDFIVDTRKKAYSVNKLYWVNLLITSINNDKDIIISDLWDEDLYGGYVTPIVSDQILSPQNEHFIFPDPLSNISVKNLIEEINHKLYNRK